MRLPFGKKKSIIHNLAIRTGINSASDEFLAEALTEIEESKAHKPTWASALSQAGGNESKAKALYIRMRGDALSKEATTTAATSSEIESLLSEISNIDKTLVSLLQESARLKEQLPYVTTSIQQSQRFASENKLRHIAEKIKKLNDRKRELELICSAKKKTIAATQ